MEKDELYLCEIKWTQRDNKDSITMLVSGATVEALRKMTIKMKMGTKHSMGMEMVLIDFHRICESIQITRTNLARLGIRFILAFASNRAEKCFAATSVHEYMGFLAQFFFAVLIKNFVRLRIIEGECVLANQWSINMWVPHLFLALTKFSVSLSVSIECSIEQLSVNVLWLDRKHKIQI